MALAMRTASMLTVIAFVAAAGPAAASPFVIRYGGSNTALAVDQSSIGISGGVRVAWTYEFFRNGSIFMKPRLQILATRLAVNCLTHDRRDLAQVGYLASGARLSTRGPDKVWIDSLRGSNTDLILSAICDGPDEAWTMVRAKTALEAYRAAWR